MGRPKTNSSQAILVATTLDMTADIEITGTSVLNRGLDASSSGDNTLVTVGAAEHIKLYKAFLSVEADITGAIILKIGSIVIGKIRNPKLGAQYIFLSTFPDFEYGALGDDLIVNLPGTTAVTINVSYEIV